jgi:hypothetical protein
MSVKSLVGQSQGNTYRQLLHVPGGVPSGSEESIHDGDGTEVGMKVGSDNINISSHNGINKGLKLQNTLVTSSGSELNQLKDREVGGNESGDIATNASTSTFSNKTIDGGTF